MAVDSRDGELAAWLAENREPLLRRWLGLVVERSSLSELAGRPFGERMQELDLLLEAARSQAADEPDAAPAARPPATPEPLLAAIETRREAGAPFSIAIFDPPSGDGPPARAWAQALAFVTRPGEPAFPAGGGATTVLLDAASARDARVAAHGIRAGAWELLGGRCPLPEVGVAVHPDDPDLLAAARRRAAAPEPQCPRAGDLWQALAEERDRAAGDEPGPPAPVTPLRPI
ncbi:MAG TPA: hypothetical protein VNT32_10365 [Thermoleophilaceae bacterium]|nr:hypothetical protein [Thermoleophilaceae bacterium]